MSDAPRTSRPKLTHARSQALQEVVLLLDFRMGVIFNDFTPAQRRAMKKAKKYLTELVAWGATNRKPRQKRKAKVAA